jgi:N-acyl homoserine lactone hydrolase
LSKPAEKDVQSHLVVDGARSKPMKSIVRVMLIGSASVLLVACAGVPIVSFEAPAQTGAGWDAVLSAQPKIELRRVVTGRIQGPRSMLVNLKDPRAQELKDDRVWVPDPVYVLQHQTLGTFLIDTGLDASFASNPQGSVTGLVAASKIWPAEPASVHPVAPTLSAQGLIPRAVFFTHLHPGETAGLRDLPQDVRLVVGPGERIVDVPLFFVSGHFDRAKRLEMLRLETMPERAELGRTVDLLGDGSIWAIHTPGHTPGHLSYLVISTQGPLLITGAASDLRWGWEREVEPGMAEDQAAAHSSLAKLRAFVARHPTVTVVHGHDEADAPGGTLR